MTVQAVLPSIYPLWTQRCLDGMSDAFRAQTLVIDNTKDNRGVAASWNLGIDALLRASEAEWLVIVSAATRFGRWGGDDFLDACAESTAHRPPPLAVEAGHGVGWHLIALSRTLVETVGKFDTIFWPAYYEDVDYGRRIQLAYPEIATGPFWAKVPDLDVSIAGFSHGVDLGRARIDNTALAAKYARKWGGAKGDETFTHPYNLSALPLSFIGEP